LEGGVFVQRRELNRRESKSSGPRVEPSKSAAKVSDVYVQVQGQPADWYDTEVYEEAISFHPGTSRMVRSIARHTKWRAAMAGPERMSGLAIMHFPSPQRRCPTECGLVEANYSTIHFLEVDEVGDRK